MERMSVKEHNDMQQYIELDRDYRAAQNRLFHTKALDPSRKSALRDSEEALEALVQFEREHPELLDAIWEYNQKS